MASRMAGKQQPFAYVNAQPDMRTPAGQGGMLLGDAILQLGDACHLRDIQEVLHANRERRVPVHVIDAQGHFVTRHIIPRVWDSRAPASLLGCQMSNVVPPSHPALTGAAPKAASAASSRAAVDPDGADWAAKTQQKETVLMQDKSRGGPAKSCWPRLTLGEPTHAAARTADYHQAIDVRAGTLVRPEYGRPGGGQLATHACVPCLGQPPPRSSTWPSRWSSSARHSASRQVRLTRGRGRVRALTRTFEPNPRPNPSPNPYSDLDPGPGPASGPDSEP